MTPVRAPPVRMTCRPPLLPGLWRGVAALGMALAMALASSLSAAAAPATVDDDLMARGREIESYLPGFPHRAMADLAELAPRAAKAPPEARRFIEGLTGHALTLSGRTGEALLLADRLEAAAAAAHDDALQVTALLIRGQVQLHARDAAFAGRLAEEARHKARGTPDGFLRFWAALQAGTAARQRGQTDEALASLHEALAAADDANNANQRGWARYQLAALHVALKQPARALEESAEAFRQGSLANNANLMARAKMVESSAYQLQNQPGRELAMMKEALAIARSTGSRVTEGTALVNIADSYLQRRDFRSALEAARQGYEIAREFDDLSLMATAKANMGFAMLGAGRVEAGKRLADEAVGEYERTRATADMVGMLGEYAQYLEGAGDYKAALAVMHRERKLTDEIETVARDKIVLELQGRYEAEKREREIQLLNRDNDLKTAELQNRQLQQRVWWLLALVFAASFIVVAVLYRKLQATNRLLARTNVELKSQSSRDPLTALYNRRYFHDFIRDDAPFADRREAAGERPTQALLLIDIDHFKDINDRHGHAAGDAVLVIVARRLRDTLRETDMIVRWGGEEFLVFVPVAPADRLDEIVARLMHAMSDDPIVWQGNAIRITASIGYSPMPLPPHAVALSWDRAIGLVDRALYVAKSRGRDRACGIRRLVGDDDERALAAAEHDLAGAWRDGLVEVGMLHAGVPERAPAH